MYIKKISLVNYVLTCVADIYPVKINSCMLMYHAGWQQQWSLCLLIPETHLEPTHKFQRMPFDMYCPSVSNQLDKRICHQCGQYFPSQAANRSRSGVHRHATDATVEAAEDDAPDETASAATLSSVRFATWFFACRSQLVRLAANGICWCWLTWFDTMYLL